jgi:hypothetical protein
MDGILAVTYRCNCKCVMKNMTEWKLISNVGHLALQMFWFPLSWTARNIPGYGDICECRG